MRALFGFFFLSAVQAVFAVDRYPVECAYSGGKLHLTIQLGALADSANVEYRSDDALVMTAGTEREKVTVTVERCVAYLVLTRRDLCQEGVEGDMVVSRYSSSAVATYPYFLPGCVANYGALYQKSSDSVTLILLPVDTMAQRTVIPD